MTDEKEVSKIEEKTETPKNKEDETELESAIIRQVEFYFRDANIFRDRFLKDQIKLDDGWVPLDIMIKFNRLSNLTVDLDVIAKALNKSTTGLLEVSEDNRKVRRHPELPIPEMTEESKRERRSRTIYAKGFPKDSTLDELLSYFKQFENVDIIIMRKYQERFTKVRLFKGSIFVTFKTKEQAKKFIKTKDLSYNDNPLMVQWQDDYIKQKRDEYNSKREMKESQFNQEEENIRGTPMFKLPTGTILKFTGASGKTTREDIRNAFTALGAEVAYVDYKLGDTDGWVRLTKENSSKEFAGKQPDGKIKISDTDVEFKLLESNEEAVYLDKAVEAIKKRVNFLKFNRYNKEMSFKGKQGMKRKQNNHEDAPPRKV